MDMLGHKFGPKDIQHETFLQDSHFKKIIRSLDHRVPIYGPQKILGKNAVIAIFACQFFSHFLFFGSKFFWGPKNCSDPKNNFNVHKLPTILCPFLCFVISTCIKQGSWAQMIPPHLNRVKGFKKLQGAKKLTWSFLESGKEIWNFKENNWPVCF